MAKPGYELTPLGLYLSLFLSNSLTCLLTALSGLLFIVAALLCFVSGGYDSVFNVVFLLGVVVLGLLLLIVTLKFINIRKGA